MSEVRVLVVDDQEPFRRACAAVIEALEGFVLVGVGGSGEQSPGLVLTLSPDLVLMDVNLPGMSGIEATRLLRELDPTLAVVLVSTYEQSECGTDTEACGAAAFLDKSSFSARTLGETWDRIRWSRDRQLEPGT